MINTKYFKFLPVNQWKKDMLYFNIFAITLNVDNEKEIIHFEFCVLGLCLLLQIRWTGWEYSV